MKKLFTILLLAGAMIAPASNAHAFLNNWYFDADGSTGTGSSVLVKEYFDIIGQAYINVSIQHSRVTPLIRQPRWLRQLPLHWQLLGLSARLGFLSRMET
jgi:hypothetical protein